MARIRLGSPTPPVGRSADAQTTLVHHMARTIRANAAEQSQSIEGYVADAIRRTRVDDSAALVLFVQAVALIAVEDGRCLRGGGPNSVLGVAVQR